MESAALPRFCLSPPHHHLHTFRRYNLTRQSAPRSGHPHIRYTHLSLDHLYFLVFSRLRILHHIIWLDLSVPSVLQRTHNPQNRYTTPWYRYWHSTAFASVTQISPPPRIHSPNTTTTIKSPNIYLYSPINQQTPQYRYRKNLRYYRRFFFPLFTLAQYLIVSTVAIPLCISHCCQFFLCFLFTTLVFPLGIPVFAIAYTNLIRRYTK